MLEICELLQKKILIIDCQTTGMHPNKGHLLQIGWKICDPNALQIYTIEKWTLKLPLDQEIPYAIKKLLKLTDEELAQSCEPNIVFDNLQQVLKKLGPEPVVIAHYAQFEKSFLKKFYQDHHQTDELNFDLVCSQKIAKRLLPNLPSHNLKALAGYYKLATTPKNEIISHISMTCHIWQQLIQRLVEMSIVNYSELASWLTTKPSVKVKVPAYFEYNIERLTRLEISEKPGIYRMLAQDKSILYIGKATSLKSRVNSYFRGIKNRDRRKLEMLTQVWDIDTLECDTALEAALLESDEIKKWNPPYNLLLKSENRKLLFYNYDFSHFSEIKDAIFFNGPYKPNDAIMNLISLLTIFQTATSQNISFFNENIHPDILTAAWLMFSNSYAIQHNNLATLDIRPCIALGFKLLNYFEKIHGRGTFEKWWAHEKKKNPEENLSLEQKISHKIWRTLIRAAEVKRKTKKIWRLYNATLCIQPTQKKLIVINGEIINECSSYLQSQNTTFGVVHYNRLSILLSALNKKIACLV